MRALPCGDAALLFEADGSDPANGANGSDPADRGRGSNRSADRAAGDATTATTATTDATAEVAAFARAVRRMRSARRADEGSLGRSVIDVVPAARTVLVRVRPGTDLAALRRALLALPLEPDPASEAGGAAEIVIPVVYDGADLADVAALTGLRTADVISAHVASRWVVGFCGFAPGFAYLTGGDPRLAVPRLDRPRTRVPRGSVALAGSYSAVYPGDSPGGWRLIGRTDSPVWDVDRTPPALLRPGVRVRFQSTGST